MRHVIVYRVIAFEQKLPEGSFLDSCGVWVYAESEKEAIRRAKKLVKKSFYQVTEVVEKEEGEDVSA